MLGTQAPRPNICRLLEWGGGRHGRNASRFLPTCTRAHSPCLLGGDGPSGTRAGAVMLLKAARWSRTRGRQQAGAVSLTSFMQPCKEHGAAQLFATVEGQLACSTALLFAPALQNKLASSKMYFCTPPDLNFARGFLSVPPSGLYLRGARGDGGRGFPYRRCGMGCEEASEIGPGCLRALPACAGVAGGSLVAFGYGPAWIWLLEAAMLQNLL